MVAIIEHSAIVLRFHSCHPALLIRSVFLMLISRRLPQYYFSSFILQRIRRLRFERESRVWQS